ncbi:MAG TPA: translation initiation factor IF-3 [candidate division WOR-3 bacterium]|uniref:Translation initiation factor IF-3 n=1 Tax=candidate division WOR-3 bacterium TaxID=2052148 RepID=A0A7C0XBP0_UNCW3|nr:MAG: translation initiation factor IF-3 [Candidatus Hydrothermae bacterium]HDM90845.1 translation initiation factor IF-3 [candidate division WOR-3 bacterium]
METHRVNERIRVPQVRVIGPDGRQMGIMRTRDAIELAYSMGLDLVEVSPNARPPVAKIMDYGKFKYEEKKKQKEAKKKQAGEVKEISLSPRIDPHDLEVKIKKMREFLIDGHRVKIRVFYRGREIVHVDAGRKVFDEIVEQLRDVAAIEIQPKLEGKNLIGMLKPLTRKGGKSNAKSENEKGRS